MPPRFIFADEAGNFDFSRGRGASRYFILTTITADDCAVGDALLRLRRALMWTEHEIGDGFHASEDRQAVRDIVYAELQRHAFHVDSTILEKSKAEPALTRSDAEFYRMAWHLHLERIAPEIRAAGDDLQIVGASFGTSRKRAQIRAAMFEVATQVMPHTARARVASWSAASDPCLQAADYCCWAIQRKWERGDERSHALIASRVRSEVDVWSDAMLHHY